MACRLLLALGLALMATTATAQYTHHVYLDADNNPATGCTVSAHEAGWTGTITGIERDVQISVNTTVPATVTGVAVASCSGAALGAPQTVSAGSWLVGLNVGTGGGDVIEGFLPRTYVPANSTVRLYFHSSAGAPNDVLLTTSGSGGSPMTITLDAGAGGGAAAVPGLGPVGIVALGVGIALAAFGLLRGRAGIVGALLVGALAGAGVAYAATITMNGQVGDWAGISALGTDPTGDSSIGDPAEDIVAGFATFDATNVYFRVDVWNVECSAATAPVSTITPSGPTTFCDGGSVTLTASAGTAWLWSNGATTQAITVSASGSYSVTVTNASGCSNTSAPTVVTVNPAPTATITPDGPTTFCDGGAVLLQGPPGMASYTWFMNGAPAGATTPNFMVNTSGTYTLQVTNASGCTDLSDPVVVTVNPNPVATITPDGPTTFCDGGAVLLQGPPGMTSYTWFMNGAPAGATTPNFMVNTSGTYTLQVTNASGCTDLSDPVVVTVNPLPTVSGFSISQNPVPAGGSATISFTIANGSTWTIASALGNGLSPTSGSGNGTFSVGYNADNNTGADTVTLTVTNGCGSTVRTLSVTVN